MVDHVYREKLVVRNGGKTAMKVRLGWGSTSCIRAPLQ